MLLITVLFIMLRIPHIGHLLVWDEAWILQAVKSLAGGGGAAIFQNQLWRHPPMYLTLGLILAPLKQGFAARMEIMGLMVHTASLLLFIFIIAKILGNRLAFYSGIAYAMLPGQIFFSTWVKRDALVILFCMFALWCFIKKRDLLAGVFLGLGFLSKETAVFYALGIICMIPFSRPVKSLGRSLLYILAPILIISGWWYLFFASGTKAHFTFFTGISDEAPQFAKPWWHYFTKLIYDLGTPGLLLFAAGLIAVIPKIGVQEKLKKYIHFKKNRLLPFFFLFPGYLLLSTSYGKPAWMVIALYPFLALVIGIGWSYIIKIAAILISPKNIKRKTTIHPVLSCFLLTAILSFPVFNLQYTEYLSKISPGTFNMSKRSVLIADTINQSVGKKDKLLFMPMINQKIAKPHPDPVLFWYLKPGLTIYNVYDLDMDYNAIKKTIVDKQINRLLIFPVTGSNQEEIAIRILEDINPAGLSLPGKILILQVDDFWKNLKKI